MGYDHGTLDGFPKGSFGCPAGFVQPAATLLLVAILAFVVPAILLDLCLDGGLVHLAQGFYVLEGRADVLEPLARIGAGFKELLGFGEEAGDENVGEPAGDVGAIGGIAKFVGDIDKLANLFVDLLVALPIAESALAPIGEVLFIDGTGLEVPCEEFLYFREAIKPFEESGAGLGVLDAGVELVTDQAREPCDFAVAGTACVFDFGRAGTWFGLSK